MDKRNPRLHPNNTGYIARAFANQPVEDKPKPTITVRQSNQGMLTERLFTKEDDR